MSVAAAIETDGTRKTAFVLARTLLLGLRLIGQGLLERHVGLLDGNGPGAHSVG